MNKSDYSHVVVTDLGNRNCRLEFVVDFPEGIPLKYYSDSRLADNFAANTQYYVGYLGQALKEKGFFLKEIEVVVPPVAEYMQLENKIKEGLSDKYSSVVVKKGMIVTWPDEHSEKTIIDPFDVALDRLNNEGAHNN